MTIQNIPALQDNYIYLITTAANHAVVVDPGEAAPVLPQLENRQLSAILLTHRHADHVGGVAALLAAAPDTPIYAPMECGLATTVCRGGDTVELLNGALSFSVIDTPGHTRGHIAYYSRAGIGGAPLLLSGDTLFVGGCGRVFEGTMREMHDSLAALAALPDETEIYCGHEYTLTNLRFAAAVEPDNAMLQTRRQQVEAQRFVGEATVPSVLAAERQYNPFLRLTVPAVIEAAEAHSGRTLADTVEVFGALREWKDNF